MPRAHLVRSRYAVHIAVKSVVICRQGFPATLHGIRSCATLAMLHPSHPSRPAALSLPSSHVGNRQELRCIFPPRLFSSEFVLARCCWVFMRSSGSSHGVCFCALLWLCAIYNDVPRTCGLVERGELFCIRYCQRLRASAFCTVSFQGPSRGDHHQVSAPLCNANVLSRGLSWQL